MNRKPTLQLYFAGFCLIHLLVAILCLAFRVFGVAMDFPISTVVGAFFELGCLTMLILILVSKNISGLRSLGRVGGWIYVGISVINFILPQYLNYHFMEFGIGQSFQIISVSISVLSFCSIVAMALFLFGSVHSMLLRFFIPGFLLVGLMITLLGYHIISDSWYGWIHQCYYIVGWLLSTIFAMISYRHLAVKDCLDQK